MIRACLATTPDAGIAIFGVTGTDALHFAFGSWMSFQSSSPAFRLSIVEGALIALLGMLIVGLLLERRRRVIGERELQQRLQFEILISELSWGLENGAGDGLLRATGWLQRLCNCVGADRVSLISATNGSNGTNGRSGASAHHPAWASGPAYPASEFPALSELIAHGEPVRFPSLGKLPAALERDRQSFERYGVEAALLLPLRHSGGVLGALALAGSTPHQWPHVLVERLPFVAGVLARAIAAQPTGATNQRVEATAPTAKEVETRVPQREMVRIARVGALGQFALSLAHELNQPLSAILSNAQAARRFLAAPDPPLDEVRAILDDIDADDRRAGEVIRGMRALLNHQDVRMEPLDLNDVVRGVVRLLHGDVLMRRVALVLDLEAPLPLTSCDHVQIQQALLNLVLNGFEAMQDSAYADRRLIIRTRADRDGHCVVSVRDSGRGIPQSDLPRLFDQFFSTKPDGLGMGLSISRSIIEGHGGRIWATNNSDSGATFHFTIPIPQRKEEP